MQLPNDFILQMKDIIGDENSRRLCDALAEKATVSIRLNRAKTSDIPFDTDTVGKPVAWCNDGFYLKERPLFTLDPLLHAGAYYVQEASSMFLSHVVGTLLGKRTADDDIEKTDLAPLAILDMCAAPGGKSTILRTMMPQDSLRTYRKARQHTVGKHTEAGFPEYDSYQQLPQRLFAIWHNVRFHTVRRTMFRRRDVP